MDSSDSKNFSRPLSFEPLDDRRSSKEAVLQAISQMSDHEDDSPRQEMPHIRLNSGRQDAFAETADGYIAVATTTDHTMPRPLTPAVDIPVAVGAQGMSPYGVSHVPESSEFLLPPKLRPTPSQDDRSGSPDRWSNARSSVSSASRDSRFHLDPFEDSRAPSSRSGSDEYDVNTQTVSEKFNIMPTDGLLLFPEDVEKDDYLHNPDPADREGECDIWNRRGMMNVGGLVVLTVGLLVLFIGYPIMYDPQFKVVILVLTHRIVLGWEVCSTIRLPVDLATWLVLMLDLGLCSLIFAVD